MIKIQHFTELSSDTKERINGLINDEFGDIPIVKKTSWASPDWTIINYLENEIATFYNVVVREITIDNQDLKTAGINNVITQKKFRGKGFSTKTLLDTEKFLFEDLNVNLGLFLCADDLIPFYKRLGWYKVDCPVFFDQPDGKKVWTANTMLLTRDVTMKPKKIDLNGFPW